MARARRLVVVLLVAVLAIAVTSAARAQDPPSVPSDPGEACQEQVDKNGLSSTTQGLGCDNRYTPIAKDGKAIGWSQKTGAIHPDAEKPSGYEDTLQNQIAEVPPTVDFYTVSFANSSRGFAGGAQCRETAPGQGAGESDDAYMDRITPFLNTCERVPVIYGYTDFTDKGPFWEEVYIGDSPGFVGAITWLHNTDTAAHGLRALAVGGDGSPSAECPQSETEPGCPGYPRREPAIPESAACKDQLTKPLELSPDVPPNATQRDGERELSDCDDRWRQAHDPAGKGRAWLFSDGDWQDLTRDLPKAMRGMTTVEAAHDTSICPGGMTECAFAGGLQQIWLWKNGEFDKLPWAASEQSRPVYSGSAPGRLCSDAWTCEWHYRVRYIRILGKLVSAATSGCCSSSPDPHAGQPATLSFTRETASWRVVQPDNSPQALRQVDLTRLSSSTRIRLADSRYAKTYGGGGQSPTQSYLLTPGGPERADEPPSQIVRESGLGGVNEGLTQQGGLTGDVTSHWRTSARLVAGDGDFQGHQLAFHERQGPISTPDGPEGLMDWAVGGIKKNRRGVAYTTTTRTYGPAGLDSPDPVDCPADTIKGQQVNHNNVPDCKAKEPDKIAGQTKSGHLFRLSSYFLNGFTMVGDSGVGWGVGDRGSMMRLAGNDAGASSTLRPEKAPKLGARQSSPGPQRQPYESMAPRLSEEPGTVPGLASRDEKRLDEPRLMSFGSPNPHAGDPGEVSDVGWETVKQIAMSRDGSAGWAIGSWVNAGRKTTTLYRYDGTRWRRCGTDSVEGVLRADPACEALWPLRHAHADVNSPGVALTAIARIPTEYGPDPTKADEFEAIAAGMVDATGRQPLIRYRDGRWSVDEAATRQLNAPKSPGGPPHPPGTITDIAFSSPDDGWLVARGSYRDIWHFDGEGWTKCAANLGGGPTLDATACADHNGFIPQEGVHLTSAGDRLYLYGEGRKAAQGLETTGGVYLQGGTSFADQTRYPTILWKDPGPCDKPGDSGCWQQAYDPGCIRQEPDPQQPAVTRCIADPDRSKQGYIDSLSVAIGPDGSYNGWGLGFFGSERSQRLERGPKETPFIQSEADGKTWRPVAVDDVANDYLLPAKATHGSQGGGSGGSEGEDNPKVVALPGPEGKGRVFATTLVSSPKAPMGPTIWLDPARKPGQQWHLLPAPYPQIRTSIPSSCPGAVPQTIAPDNAGGLWLPAGTCTSFNNSSGISVFYRFSDYARADVFDETSHPIKEQISAAAGGGDGSFWVATDSDVVYRYDRQTGWDRMSIPGWDPGRVRTVVSPANAIALGPDGTGVVVGKAGRIADIGPGGAVLDPAAGVLCFPEGKPPSRPPPCGTGRDLRAAAVAPGGSAMVGGDSRAFLWRPAGEEFRAVTPPPTALYAALTGISMPRPDRAWVVTDRGEIYRGELNEAGDDWSWTREDQDEFGDSLSRDEARRQQPLRAVAIDASGHGYAVGDRGTIIERGSGGAPSWKRIDAGHLDDLNTVALGPGGSGALIGGNGGLILTLADGHFELARAAHPFEPIHFDGTAAGTRSVGLALLPGYKDGQLEAWVASTNQQSGTPRSSALLHYSSDASEPLLDGASHRAQRLPDAAPLSSDAVSFAAFGNSSCPNGAGGAVLPVVCNELTGSNETADLIANRVRDEILARKDERHPAAFSLFTGDVNSTAGRVYGHDPVKTALDDSVIHDRWAELIADPLEMAGVPLFGAIGARDLSETGACPPSQIGPCARRHETGANLAWRRSMATMPAPWGAPGAEEATSAAGLTFEPVDTGGTKKELGDTAVEDPTKAAGGQTVQDPAEAADSQTVGDQRVPDGGVVGDQKLATGGARTHYALDVKRGDKPLIRLVVLDTSLKSLAASDAQQNPVEEQLGWLEDALQRPEGQRAIVLTNTPTYSYGPGANGETVTEGTVLESILMKNEVDLVVDGRLGWNALYYAYAPGIHWPCPGGSYPDRKPPPAPDCTGGVSSSQTDEAVIEAQKKAAELTGNGVSAPGMLPFLVSHSAGGRFGPDGQSDGSAADGYWRGYSIVHLDPETGEIQIEQRPVFDWIGIRPAQQRSATHVLRPGQRLSLQGFGRETLGITEPPRFSEITSQAITHCYDLVLADPDKPWLPLKAEDAEDDQLAAQGKGCANREPTTAPLVAQSEEASNETSPCAPYVCMPASIGTINDQTGEVRAGKGEQGRTFGMVILSVNEKVATYPLTFEPRPSFSPPRIPPPPPPPPAAPPAPPANPPVGTVGNLSLPTPPALPSLPLGAELVPPAPPIPPPPPGAANVAPLNLFLSTPGINIAPQSTVVPPPAPPIQPAPPGGARKEARQRQAAAQKSGSESGAEESSVDIADKPMSPDGAPMTRLENNATRYDRAAPSQSFTPMTHRGQPSAWVTGLQWGGGMTLMALVLAFGWITGRPTPRRRQPELPAPAYARDRHYRR